LFLPQIYQIDTATLPYTGQPKKTISQSYWLLSRVELTSTPKDILEGLLSI